MATPLSAAAFLATLRAEGVKVVEVGNWRTHNRNSKGAWGPVNGVIIHHTVSSGTASSVQLCYDGYTSLPGPLCHGVIDKAGVVHLVGYGRANHAGGGDPVVLQQVIDESYGTAPSRPTKGNANGVDGNARFYGFECINLGDGKDPWPAAQLDAIERVSAAICRAHGWSAKSVIGHLEWSADKVDPRGFTMPDMRARVARRLAGKPGTPTTPTEDDVSLTAAQAKQLAELHDVLVPYAGWQYKGKDEESDAYAYLRGTNASVKALTTQIAAQTAAISKLVQLVGSGVNTQQVVDAVEKAIAEAVVRVDVDVTGVENA